MGRDSEYLSGGLRLGYRLDNDARLEVSGRLFDEDADRARYANDGYRLGISGETGIQGLGDTTLYGYYTFEDLQHDGVEPVFDLARDEKEHNATIGVRYTFGGVNRYLDDWILDASYTHTTNDSNVALYDYDRNQIGVSIRRSF
uniref:DUF560 domain-containing protein n=1 Tax=Candidatus Kentrum sp. UNK TaxID=2126344 RepID=A0A451AS33_9GAMM|nr:MAG: Protein of unknown function (DUF2860) [Candidatus Kentron sp. UNK]VFK68805.1 MAG: Protein of unknown function (DUF2860) [Candidatus Kentron sp. UNK]